MSQPASRPLCCSSLVQLLSPSKLQLSLRHTPLRPLGPHEARYHIQRGRLTNQLDSGPIHTMTGVRGGKHLGRQRYGPWVKGAYVSINVARALTTSGRGPLKGPFEDLADSHVGHLTLLVNALAALARVPDDMPLFAIVYQNYNLGFAPVQVVALPRLPELATRFFDYLKNAYRFDPRTAHDYNLGPDTRARLPKAPRAADSAAGAGPRTGTSFKATLFDSED